MLKILDLPGGDRPAPLPSGADAHLPFRLEGDILEANDGAYTVSGSSGRAECVRDDHMDDRTLTPRGLALLYAGVQSCANLRAGWAAVGRAMSSRTSTGTRCSAAARRTSETTSEPVYIIFFKKKKKKKKMRKVGRKAVGERDAKIGRRCMQPAVWVQSPVSAVIMSPARRWASTKLRP